MAQKLGFFLSTSPEHENTHTVSKLAEAAMERGHKVHIFIMCDGVHNAFLPKFVTLVEKGAQIVLCSHNLAERQLAHRRGSLISAPLFTLRRRQAVQSDRHGA